jgi:N-acetylneuraminic acid mutarotase
MMKAAVLVALTVAAFACGGDDDPSPSATPTATRADPAATRTPSGTADDEPRRGTWRTLAPMLTPRSEVAAAELDGKIYVVGGFLGNGSATATVEVYDPATDSWATAEPMPETRHHAAAVGLNGRLYVIGGFVSSFRDATNTTFIYDPATNSWSEGAAMAVVRGGHAAAVLDGRIYAIGGARPGPADAPENVGELEVYDPGADQWQTRAEMPTPRDHLGAATVGDKIYAAGGRININFGENVDANEVYGSSDSWTSASPLPTARSGIAAASLGGRIFVFGGEANEGTFDENEAYNPETDMWESLEPMPTARHGLGAAVVGDTIYVIGGGQTPGGSVSALNEAFTR